MVAIFQTGSSLNRTLNYNEHKVQNGVAECIMAENYAVDHDKLTFAQKLARLENQAALNQNVVRNSVHISLNFDPSENGLDSDRLREIAASYMEQIGFGDQPYLVYRHHDAGHPHIHVVSVKVGPDGKRIDTQNIGKNQSEKARKAIEISFGLVKAEDSKNTGKYLLEPVSAEKVQYGKSETKRAISNILSKVLNGYRYSSLSQLSALLKLYNITAERGSEHSRMYKGKGLMYRALDSQGNKIGAPIKASQFWMQPTLKKLEEKFLKNEVQKHPLKARIKNAIDMALLKNPSMNINGMMKILEKDGISTVLWQDQQGSIYGITFIDHKNKVVFKGSELGKQYKSNAIQQRCGRGIPSQAKDISTIRTTNENKGQQSNMPISTGRPSAPVAEPNEKSLTDMLMQPEQVYEPLPYPLKRTRKKKRRRRANDR